MPYEQPASGLSVLLWLLERIMHSLDERLASPGPSLSLPARLGRLVAGNTLLNQAGRAACSMLRAILAVVASSLPASLTADLQAHAREGEPAQDAAVLPLPRTEPMTSVQREVVARGAGAAAMPRGRNGDGPPASMASDGATCAADGGSMADGLVAAVAMVMTHAAEHDAIVSAAVALPGSGAGDDVPVTEFYDADKVGPRTPGGGAPDVELDSALPDALAAGARSAEGDAVAGATARARAPTLTALFEIRVLREAAIGGRAETAAALSKAAVHHSVFLRRLAEALETWCRVGRMAGGTLGRSSTAGGVREAAWRRWAPHAKVDAALLDTPALAASCLPGAADDATSRRCPRRR